MVKRTKVTKCRVCGGENYAALIYMICDRCLVDGMKQLQEAFNLCHPECGTLKLDVDHYPVEDHEEFYGIEWKEHKCTCGSKPEEEGVWQKKETAAA